MVLTSVEPTIIVAIVSGVALVLSVTLPIILNHRIKKSEDKDAEAKTTKQEETKNLIKDVMKDELPDILEKSISEQIKPLEDKMNILNDNLKVNSEGTVTILRDKMKDKKDLFEERGYATASDKAAWHELLNSYKSLGGNHFREYVNQWTESVDSLPTEKPVKKSTKRKTKKILVEDM